jgi:metallo-beta-lactamase family protein
MKLTFYGATESVTGSCFLLQTSKANILIDCGAIQGEPACATTNMKDFSFEASEISVALVTHAHFDHTGRLPKLVRDGFTGIIYATTPTKSLAHIVLEDSLSVMRSQAAKCGHGVPYEEADVVACMGHMKGVSYGEQVQVAPGVLAMFHDAGHILGSSYITLDIDGSETATGKLERIVFSGDLGNDNTPILPDTEPLDHADILICESTYGDKVHEEVSTRGAKLAEVVNTVIGRGGTLMIPAFSIERTQELLYELDILLSEKKIPEVPIYLDSPLAIRATEIYRDCKAYLVFDHPASNDGDFFAFPNLHETLTQRESLEINVNHKPKIIIAGNGMMSGGRILHHMLRYLGDVKSAILIIGYQAAYALGRQIQDGAKTVEIFHDKVAVKASIHNIESFSAHGDRTKLLKFMHPLHGAVPKIFLTHGETDIKNRFTDFLKTQGITNVTVPQLGQSFEL